MYIHMPKPVRFAILSSQHSGTHWVRAVLSSSSGIAVMDEMLDTTDCARSIAERPRMEQEWLDRLVGATSWERNDMDPWAKDPAETRSPTAWAERCFGLSRVPAQMSMAALLEEMTANVSALGFLWQSKQAHELGWTQVAGSRLSLRPSVLDWLRSRHVRVVLLERTNSIALSMASPSLQLDCSRGAGHEWESACSTTGKRSEIRNVTRAELQRWAQTAMTLESVYDEAAAQLRSADIPLLHFSYERLLHQPESFCSLFSFLGHECMASFQADGSVHLRGPQKTGSTPTSEWTATVSGETRHHAGSPAAYIVNKEEVAGLLGTGRFSPPLRSCMLTDSCPLPPIGPTMSAVCLPNSSYAAPSLYLLGQQKCGTTSMAAALLAAGARSGRYDHKELHTFDDVCGFSTEHRRSIPEYNGRVRSGHCSALNAEKWAKKAGFTLRCPYDGPTVADMTPLNMRLTSLAPRLAALYGSQARAIGLVMMIREPWARLRSAVADLRCSVTRSLLKQVPYLSSFSTYLHMLRVTLPSARDDDLMFDYRLDQLFRSLYSRSLEAWLGAFSPAQFVVLPSGWCFRDARACLHAVGEQLNATITAESSAAMPHLNKRPSCEASLTPENETAIETLGAWVKERYFQPDSVRLGKLLVAGMASHLRLGGWTLPAPPLAAAAAVQLHVEQNW